MKKNQFKQEELAIDALFKDFIKQKPDKSDKPDSPYQVLVQAIHQKGAKGLQDWSQLYIAPFYATNFLGEAERNNTFQQIISEKKEAQLDIIMESIFEQFGYLKPSGQCRDQLIECIRRASIIEIQQWAKMNISELYLNPFLLNVLENDHLNNYIKQQNLDSINQNKAVFQSQLFNNYKQINNDQKDEAAQILANSSFIGLENWSKDNIPQKQQSDFLQNAQFNQQVNNIVQQENFANKLMKSLIFDQIFEKHQQFKPKNQQEADLLIEDCMSKGRKPIEVWAEQNLLESEIESFKQHLSQSKYIKQFEDQRIKKNFSQIFWNVINQCFGRYKTLLPYNNANKKEVFTKYIQTLGNKGLKNWVLNQVPIAYQKDLLNLIKDQSDELSKVTLDYKKAQFIFEIVSNSGLLYFIDEQDKQDCLNNFHCNNRQVDILEKYVFRPKIEDFQFYIQQNQQNFNHINQEKLIQDLDIDGDNIQFRLKNKIMQEAIKNFTQGDSQNFKDQDQLEINELYKQNYELFRQSENKSDKELINQIDFEQIYKENIFCFTNLLFIDVKEFVVDEHFVQQLQNLVNQNQNVLRVFFNLFIPKNQKQLNKQSLQYLLNFINNIQPGREIKFKEQEKYTGQSTMGGTLKKSVVKVELDPEEIDEIQRFRSKRIVQLQFQGVQSINTLLEEEAKHQGLKLSYEEGYIKFVPFSIFDLQKLSESKLKYLVDYFEIPQKFQFYSSLFLSVSKLLDTMGFIKKLKFSFYENKHFTIENLELLKDSFLNLYNLQDIYLDIRQTNIKKDQRTQFKKFIEEQLCQKAGQQAKCQIE